MLVLPGDGDFAVWTILLASLHGRSEDDRHCIGSQYRAYVGRGGGNMRPPVLREGIEFVRYG